MNSLENTLKRSQLKDSDENQDLLFEATEVKDKEIDQKFAVDYSDPPSFFWDYCKNVFWASTCF